ncbi:MAG: hypothetical protein ACOYI5_03150 [Christensenellales bacterium]|jgi:hypothetical protein
MTRGGAARCAEAVFDAIYLMSALALGIFLFATSQGGARALAGAAAYVLVGGDAFHLLPRIFGGTRRALGAGKLAASVTMTVFYILLWHLGESLYAPGAKIATYALYALCALRIALCLFPNNRWFDEKPPVSWGILRNIPFAVIGAMVAIFYAQRATGALAAMPIAIALSFLFYLPVVLFAHKRPAVGMLMLPKSAAYIWMLALCARHIP